MAGNVEITTKPADFLHFPHNIKFLHSGVSAFFTEYHPYKSVKPANR